MRHLISTILLFLSFFILAQDDLLTAKKYTAQLISYPDNSPLIDADIYYKGSVYRTNSRGFVELAAEKGDSIMVKHPFHEGAIIEIPENDHFQVRIGILRENLIFEGANESFYEQLENTISYPYSAMKKGYRGTIMVHFHIDENGEMVLSPESGDKRTLLLEREVLFALTKVKGNWSSEYTGAQFTLPVTFYMGRKSLDFDHFVPKGYLLDEITISKYPRLNPATRLLSPSIFSLSIF